MAETFVHVKGLKELNLALETFPAKLYRSGMRGAMRAGAKVFAAAAQRGVPARSGKLRKGIRVRTSMKPGQARAKVVSTEWYSKFVEMGTAAHIISGKNGGWLRLHGGSFVRSVDHPGAKPHPFMRPAFDSQGPQATLAIGLALKKTISKAGMLTPDVMLEGDT